MTSDAIEDERAKVHRLLHELLWDRAEGSEAPIDEIDVVLMSAGIEFLHRVPVNMTLRGAKAVRASLLAAGYEIKPVERQETR